MQSSSISVNRCNFSDFHWLWSDSQQHLYFIMQVSILSAKSSLIVAHTCTFSHRRMHVWNQPRDGDEISIQGDDWWTRPLQYDTSPPFYRTLDGLHQSKEDLPRSTPCGNDRAKCITVPMNISSTSRLISKLSYRYTTCRWVSFLFSSLEPIAEIIRFVNICLFTPWTKKVNTKPTRTHSGSDPINIIQTNSNI